MIKEAYCSDEVCKLLKKRGFPQDIKGLTKGVIRENGETFVRPTHQMATAWLRMWNKHIEVTWLFFRNEYHWESSPAILDSDEGVCQTYEEGVELALKQSLSEWEGFENFKIKIYGCEHCLSFNNECDTKNNVFSCDYSCRLKRKEEEK